MMNLRAIGRYLDEGIKLMLVKKLVISKLDYCNSLYMNLPKTRLPYKTFLWRTNLRRPKFWRSENMAKLNKNRHISGHRK